jgi:hypothetical protein
MGKKDSKKDVTLTSSGIKKEDILDSDNKHKQKSTEDQEKQGKALLEKLRVKF